MDATITVKLIQTSVILLVVTLLFFQKYIRVKSRHSRPWAVSPKTEEGPANED